jgi:hypothetical protein
MRLVPAQALAFSQPAPKAAEIGQYFLCGPVPRNRQSVTINSEINLVPLLQPKLPHQPLR